MDLLPLEFAKLERPLVNGPAPSDSDGSEFYEELRQAERARADELSPTEEEPWERDDQHIDTTADRPEPRKPENPSEETTRSTSPEGRLVENDATNPDGNAAEAKDPAQQQPIGFATSAAVPAAPGAAAIVGAPAGTSPQPALPLGPETAVDVPSLPPTGQAKTPIRPTAETAQQAASLPTNPALGNALQPARDPYGPLATPTHSLPAPGTAPTNAQAVPALASETPGGQVVAEASIPKSTGSKANPLDSVAIKRIKAGHAGPATLARRITLQANATELKSALASGANQAGPAEWTGGNAFGAFAGAANFANPAGSYGPASSAFGIALPNGLPQAGGGADAFSIDGQSAPRRGAAVEQVAVRLQVAVKQGQDHINIRLHPAELGRVEVKLDFAEDGPLRAMLIAERSDTLELLQRDAGQLERTLAQAGLKLDSGSLNFGLQGQAHDGDGTGEKPSTGAGSASAEAGEEDPAALQGRWTTHDGVLDLVI